MNWSILARTGNLSSFPYSHFALVFDLFQILRIRPWYVFEKSVGAIGIMMILYMTIEHFIYPVLEKMHLISFFDSLTQLLLPFMVCYVLIFYVIFEVRPAALAVPPQS